ncbi:MAG: hypothetical protein IE931_04215 [Sphingobacteriales bacterium]|nr:hypothetical protein [Sphingobacteriales bacterium]
MIFKIISHHSMEKSSPQNNNIILTPSEYAFQNHEKKKKASALIIANKELIFQNQEKEKRAAELAIANQELAYQNREKEKRADELEYANQELKKAETYLKYRIRDLEKMTFITSHKVRQPVANILGLVEIIEKQQSKEELLESIGFMKKSAEDLDLFIKELSLFVSDLKDKWKE